MKASFEPISEVEVRIDVELPAETVDKELGKQLSVFSRRARVKGFRPGKAPKDVVRKTFAGDIAVEATRKLISNAFEEALESVGKGRVVGQPSVMEPEVAVAGKPLTFQIRAQVKPNVEVHSWRGIEVSVAPVNITAEAVNARIAAIQEKHKERVPVEDRAADTNDICMVSFQGWLEGERDTRLDGEQLEVRIGAGNMIPGWEDELIGMSVDEVRKFDITFPADYRATDLAGKKATFEVTLESLLFEEIPELDDDLATDAGYESLDDLREKTASKLGEELTKDREQAIETGVLKVFLERNAFEVPSAMVESFAGDRARSLLSFWRMQGLPESRAAQFLRENWQGMLSRAKQEVRQHLALEALARQEELEVSDDELSEAIVEFIKTEGEAAAATYERPEMREALMNQLMMKKALTHLIAHARVVDADAAEADAAQAEPETTD